MGPDEDLEVSSTTLIRNLFLLWAMEPMSRILCSCAYGIDGDGGVGVTKSASVAKIGSSSLNPKYLIDFFVMICPGLDYSPSSRLMPYSLKSLVKNIP